VACNLESAGFKALVKAFNAVTGDCKPYSITGSLPCIRELQDAGFMVNTLGFGKLAAYHANNGAGVQGWVRDPRVVATNLARGTHVSLCAVRCCLHHAEYAFLSDFEKGFKVLTTLLAEYDG
jgi:hypothetical protein